MITNEELQNRLDNVGWMPKKDERYDYAVFRWMQEATARIDYLSAVVDSLKTSIENLERLNEIRDAH